MEKTKFLFFLFFAFLGFNTSFAQNELIQKIDSTGIYKLSDVVVTATRTNANTIYLANSISVIDSAEITNRNTNNLFDLLKNEYGLSFTQQGGNGTLSNVYIRGSNSSQTLVLIDGVEVNLPSDPSGVYDFSGLQSDNISRIEVLRGPQSTVYGSDALAGVINIITKNGDGNSGYSAMLEGGSYNFYKGLAGANGSFDNFKYSLTLSKTKSDGFSAASDKYGNTEKDGYEFYNGSAIFGYKASENLELNLYTRYVNTKSDYDQFGGFGGDDPTYVFDQEEYSVRAEGKGKLSDGKWSQKAGLSFFRNIRKYSFDTSAASIYYSNSNYDGRKYKVDWQNDLDFIPSNLITFGAEFELEESSSEYYAYTFLSPPDYMSVFPKKSANTVGLFLQDQVTINKCFFSSIGVRYDHHNKFGSYFTYRIAPAYIIWQTGTKIKATIGTGFKAPSLFYLYDPAYGNENLNPEKSFGWDAGVEQFFWQNGFSVGATYFSNKFDEMFGFDPVTFKTININSAEANGVEVFIKARPINELDVKVNYTYTEAKDKSEGSANYDRRLLRRPLNKTGLYFSYTFSNNANINLETIFVGKRDDLNFATFSTVQLDSYTLINFAAHYNLTEYLRLNLRLENLLDADYEEVYGYATPGRSIYGGVSLNF